jgi:hypothetical protein
MENADNCISCCEDDFGDCKAANDNDPSLCHDPYSSCTLKCKPLFYDAEIVKDKVILSNSLSLSLTDGTSLDLKKVRRAIFNAINNPAITMDDIFIESSDQEGGSRRAGNMVVTITYVIRVPVDDAASVEESTNNADMMTSLGSEGLPVDSVENMLSGAAEATTPAPESTQVVVYNYIIVTVIFDLPDLAYMTQVQMDALAAAYLDAYSFALDTPVTVDVDEDGIVTIRCTIDHEPTENDLAPKVLPISYTDGSDAEVSDFTVTEASSANDASTSGSAFGTGAIIGIAVGACALLVLVVVVVVFMRSSRRLRRTSHV